MELFLCASSELLMLRSLARKLVPSAVGDGVSRSSLSVSALDLSCASSPPPSLFRALHRHHSVGNSGNAGRKCAQLSAWTTAEEPIAWVASREATPARKTGDLLEPPGANLLGCNHPEPSQDALLAHLAVGRRGRVGYGPLCELCKQASLLLLGEVADGVLQKLVQQRIL